ncbi:hypothetical protein G9P44_000787 [Scheffersomyces stipitis]|nr:hypothetical protein G9P44_000787 [Scheffersomyces stipitis]
MSGYSLRRARVRRNIKLELEEDDMSTESVDDSSVSVSSDDEEIKEDIIEYKVSNSDTFVVKPKTFYERHEVPRKIFHSLTAPWVLLLYVTGQNQRTFVNFLIVVTLICFGQDLLRFKFPKFNDWFTKLYGPVMRSSERNGFNGIGFFLIGLLYNCAYMPKDMTIVSSMFLSWGDTTASLAGREFGKYTPKITKNKSLAGFLANFVVSTLICYFFYGIVVPYFHATVDLPGDIWYEPEHSQIKLPFFGVICGFVSASAELIEFVDDNLTIPIVTSTIMYGIIYVSKTN